MKDKKTRVIMMQLQMQVRGESFKSIQHLEAEFSLYNIVVDFFFRASNQLIFMVLPCILDMMTLNPSTPCYLRKGEPSVWGQKRYNDCKDCMENAVEKSREEWLHYLMSQDQVIRPLNCF